MFTTGVNYAFTKNHVIDVEGVYTKNDINTFSRFNSGDDDGYGLKLNSNNQTVIKRDSIEKQSLNAIYNF